MAPKGRRGVLVTTSKAKRAKTEEENERLQSQKEWEDLEQEAKQIVRLRVAAENGRQSAAYDDVAVADAEVIDKAPTGPTDSSRITGPEKKDDIDKSDSDNEKEPTSPHEEEGTTGQPKARARKRAGKKKSGAQKKREKVAREEGLDPKRQKEEDDDRWLKLRLAGEEKPRRIDANRIVSYYDFDGRGNPIRKVPGVSFDTADDEEDFIPGDRLATNNSGNFRASLRGDLWAEDSDES
ncbi:unnamed protein product [Durusdinium trenchii]|uniref:Uncharacterized protein n=1 Tax=Durusdinium trenchii TaxID=1381693 RepID=A0ABP0L827_9DINO